MNLIFLGIHVSCRDKSKLQYFCSTINLCFEKCFIYYFIPTTTQKVGVLSFPHLSNENIEALRDSMSFPRSIYKKQSPAVTQVPGLSALCLLQVDFQGA